MKRRRTMYAGVCHYTIGHGSADAFGPRVDAEFVSTRSQEPGFVFFAVDMGSGKVETISIVHDQETADGTDELAVECVRDNLAGFEPVRSEVTAGDMLLNRTASEVCGDAHRRRGERARRRSS